MRTLSRVFISVFLILGITPLYADKTKCEICVVDVRRLVAESKTGQQVKKDLQSDLKKYENQIQSLKSKLTSLQKEISAQGAILSEEALLKKQRGVEVAERDLSYAVKDAKEALVIKEQDALKNFLKTLDKAILAWSKANPKSVVLEKDPGFVVYASNSIDITSEIKPLLN